MGKSRREKKEFCFLCRRRGFWRQLQQGSCWCPIFCTERFFLLAVWMAVRFMTSLILDASERRVAGYFYAGLFFFYLLWVVIIPFGGGADEKMRYLIPEFIFRHGTLPAGYDQQIRNDLWGYLLWLYAHCMLHPSGSFDEGSCFSGYGRKMVISSGAHGQCDLFHGSGIRDAAGSEEIFVPAKNSLVFTAFVMFLPQYVFVSSYVNSECFWHAGSDFADLAGFKGTGKRISHSFLHRDRSRDCPYVFFLITTLMG